MIGGGAAVINYSYNISLNAFLVTKVKYICYCYENRYITVVKWLYNVMYIKDSYIKEDYGSA